MAERWSGDAHGNQYAPWTENGVMGFRVTAPDGRVEYVYLNPSSESDDGVANVFLYHGTTGRPSEDGPVVYVDLFTCMDRPDG